MNIAAIFHKETEAQFMASVIRLAELFGWRVWHDRATNARRVCRDCGAPTRVPRNDAGLPDLLLVRRPRVIFAEIKAERGKLSSSQFEWLAALDGCGVECYVWKPSQWRIIEDLLR